MTDKPFGAKLMALPEIFKKRLFTVPDYQRGYAWEKKQVAELLKDIDHLMSDGMTLRHYTGTLVLSHPDGVDENNIFYIVDGQQRLTTLVTVMWILCKHLPKTEQSTFTALYLVRGDVGNERTVLCLNSDTQLFFERLLLGDGNIINNPPTMEAHERLIVSHSLVSKQ